MMSRRQYTIELQLEAASDGRISRHAYEANEHGILHYQSVRAIVIHYQLVAARSSHIARVFAGIEDEE